MNSITIDGYLIKDADFHHFKSGSLVTFAISHKQYVGDRKGYQASNYTNFIYNVKYFYKESQDWLENGVLTNKARVVILGRLTTEEWETQDGGKGSKVVIKASDIIPCPGKESQPQRVQPPDMFDSPTIPFYNNQIPF